MVRFDLIDSDSTRIILASFALLLDPLVGANSAGLVVTRRAEGTAARLISNGCCERRARN